MDRLDRIKEEQREKRTRARRLVDTAVMAQELYKILDALVCPENNYNHVPYSGSMDLLITGEDLNNALDVLKKYKSILAV